MPASCGCGKTRSSISAASAGSGGEVRLPTNVALYLLGGRSEDPLPAGEHLVSVITELELLAYPSLGGAEEERIKAFLDAVAVVGLAQEVKSAAVRLRREHRLKLPDAIVAATALASDAVLLTNDSRLAAIEQVRAASLRLKPAEG